MIGDKPSVPLTWRHVTLVGVLLAALVVICLICGWTAVNTASGLQ